MQALIGNLIVQIVLAFITRYVDIEMGVKLKITVDSQL